MTNKIYGGFMKYIIGTGELVIKEFDNHDVLVKNKEDILFQ